MYVGNCALWDLDGVVGAMLGAMGVPHAEITTPATPTNVKRKNARRLNVGSGMDGPAR
jgi:hypothetical protein